MKKTVVALILLCLSPAVVAAGEVLSESFENDILPAQWTIENFGGFCDWIFETGSRLNSTGGTENFAYAESDQCPDRPMDTALNTPSINCSTRRGTTLSFKYDIYSGKVDTVFAVQISVDGGDSWEKIWSRTGEVNADFQTALIDISERADGQPDVQIRFRYTASNDWWWQLDDVVVSSNESEKFNWLLFLPAIISKKSP
ncbi:MAG: hypothetical protein D3916_08800 [Candidatus Electrothrix sp. MAN1_4]|nr:hypothetical protein [Candidatus Electrothrix sp. MAN1_4]